MSDKEELVKYLEKNKKEVPVVPKPCCSLCYHHTDPDIFICTKCDVGFDQFTPLSILTETAPTAPKNIEQENKPKPSLIPWDIILEFDEPPYQEGLKKYHRESWRGGFKISDMFDACQRHLILFMYHLQDYDQETWENYKIKKHHLGAAKFCITCMCQTLKEHPELDDRKELFKIK